MLKTNRNWEAGYPCPTPLGSSWETGRQNPFVYYNTSWVWIQKVDPVKNHSWEDKRQNPFIRKEGFPNVPCQMLVTHLPDDQVPTLNNFLQMFQLSTFQKVTFVKFMGIITKIETWLLLCFSLQCVCVCVCVQNFDLAIEFDIFTDIETKQKGIQLQHQSSTHTHQREVKQQTFMLKVEKPIRNVSISDI